MPSTTFKFGVDPEHEVRIDCGLLGREKYFVNDKLIHSRWSFTLGGIREFIFENHTIQVHISIKLRRADAKAYVDGVLVAEDLFFEFNANLARIRSK